MSELKLEDIPDFLTKNALLFSLQCATVLNIFVIVGKAGLDINNSSPLS